MDAYEWFSKLIHKYREVVKKDYFEIKDEFPFYSPTDIDVVLIDDQKNYFPEIMAFFNSGYSEDFPANDIITVQTKKIEWKKDFETRQEYDTKWHETFYDITSLPGVIAQESFKKKINIHDLLRTCFGGCRSL
jgi:hypothetical protein